MLGVALWQELVKLSKFNKLKPEHYSLMATNPSLSRLIFKKIENRF